MSLRCFGLSLGLALVLGGSAWGQTPGPGAPVRKAVEWDVVSVKENRLGWQLSHPDYDETPDEIKFQNYSLRRIIQMAMNFRRPNMVFGLPPWALTSRYDIVAKVSEADAAAFGALSDTERTGMLLSILQERFHLKSHIEMREMSVFALEVAKTGPRLKETTASAPGEVDWTSDFEIAGQGVTMADLMYALSGWRNGLDRPVIDRTGLKGRYDIRLRFTPGRGTDMDDDDDPNDPGVWVFTAIERQLGLRLVATRGQVECLVVDSIEPPTEN